MSFTSKARTRMTRSITLDPICQSGNGTTRALAFLYQHLVLWIMVTMRDGEQPSAHSFLASPSSHMKISFADRWSCYARGLNRCIRQSEGATSSTHTDVSHWTQLQKLPLTDHLASSDWTILAHSFIRAWKTASEPYVLSVTFPL
jgi:hypothetical protein